MRIPHDSYVLVADGAKMLFFRNERDAENINLEVLAAEQQADAADGEIKRDASGHKPGSVGMAGGSSTSETDFHQQAEDDFAAETAARINRAALAGDFEHLVIVAAPRTLGELRRHYHKEVVKRITAEIPKDLANHPVNRIEQALAAYEK